MTPKKGILGSGLTLDMVMCLVLVGFGIGLSVVSVINGGVWLLLLLLGVPLLGLGIAGVVLAWRNRL
ncbi:MAG: hypothetical protein QOG43_1650 [Actinomycetota bacterium]|nr:hypothetical protein [Actinomycetota bacterium]